MKAIRPKKIKFNTLAGIAMNKIATSISYECLIQGGVMKVSSLEDKNYPTIKEKIQEIIEDHFNKKASKVCKINYFDSNLYLCFKKTF